MSDIAERLRALNYNDTLGPYPLTMEAADEIERLRVHNKVLCDNQHNYVRYCTRIHDFEVENERLQGKLDLERRRLVISEECCTRFMNFFQEAAEEIERLQAHAKSMVDALNADIDAKAAEIERLRVLVKDLADDLEDEVEGHYPPEVRKYPGEQRRYERDMDNVYKARRALDADLPTANDVRGILKEKE